MIEFSHGVVGWDVLFSFILFGATVLFGLHAIHASFNRSVQAISARATADLTRAHAELEGLCHRMDSLEQQLSALTERVNRCEADVQLLMTAIRSK